MLDHNEKALQSIFHFYGYLNSLSKYFILINYALLLAKIFFRFEWAFQNMSTFDKLTKVFPSVDI